MTEYDGKVSSLLAVSKEVKTLTCVDHGEYESRNIFQSVWSHCPVCAANNQAIRERENQEKAATEKHLKWQSKLGAAGIPERFKTRSLETYAVDNDGQRTAINFAIEFVEKFGQDGSLGRSAILCGQPGTGKTHISIGIAIEIMKSGKSAMFTTVQRIIRRVKDTFKKESEESESAVIALLVYPDLLIIDEIGVQFGSEFEKNFMFDLINERYEKQKSTLFLSNLTAKEIKVFLGERIYDRLKEDGGKCVSFDWPSYRGARE